MITVVVPTLNSGETLAATLTALVPGVVEGVVREVVIVDGGSTDRTLGIAESSGAEVVTGVSGRGAQLRAGAERANFAWILFLHSDTVLDPGWEQEAAAFIERIESGRRDTSAAAFTFALDDDGAAPRLLEWLVRLRCAILRLPYGDQGLLIPRTLYHEAGGYRPLPIMEDIDLIGRLPRNRLAMLRTRAVTSPARYRGGYVGRVLRNQVCLALYALGVSPQRIAAIYAGGGSSREPMQRAAPARES
jgi:rSAM/selenodomain-associated transferase 2